MLRLHCQERLGQAVRGSVRIQLLEHTFQTRLPSSPEAVAEALAACTLRAHWDCTRESATALGGER